MLRWDAELAQLGRGVGRFNLEIGVALEPLKRKGWHRELGYSSLEGYALERCSRTGRWAAEAAALARGLKSLPQLRAALVQARVSLSMATLLSAHTNAETDEFMTAKAQRSTVRQMRMYLRGLAVRDERVGGADPSGPESKGETGVADGCEPDPSDAEAGAGQAASREGSPAEPSCQATEDEPDECRLRVSMSRSDYLV